MPISHQTNIARHLREAREAAGLSQSELAAKSGITTTTISRTERDRTTPDLPTLEALAHGLGLTLGQLLEGDLPGL